MPRRTHRSQEGPEPAHPRPQRDRDVVPEAGDEQEADDQQHAAADAHDEVAVFAHPADGAEEATEQQPHDAEGQAQPEAVDEREQSTAHRAGLSEGEGLHRTQCRTDARGPPETEDDAEERGAPQTDGRHLVHAVFALHPRQPAQEHQAETDDDQAEHLGDDRLVLQQHRTEGTEQRAVGDEHCREAEDEQQRAGDDTALGACDRRGHDRGDSGRAFGYVDIAGGGRAR